MRNLLIGNGLNLTNYKENSFLHSSNIYNRFIQNLHSYWDIICKLVYQNEMDINTLIYRLDPSDGIEKLAGIVFQYIYDNVILNEKFIRNYSYRLVEILGEISIKSIFFEDNIFKVPKIEDKYINKILNEYDKVFSLNYIEDWDKNNKVKYLHGNLRKYINSFSDIGSSVLSNNKDYILFKATEYKKIDFRDIVFMPTNDIISKYNYIIEGLNPGDDLFPADDLFPYEGRDIYKELDNLNNIDIFGMSPDGDDAIINKLKNIKDIKIYVFEMKTKEIEKWKNYGIKAEFIDSGKFIKV